MSVAGLAKAAAGAKVHGRSTATTVLPKTKWMVEALTLLALVTSIVVILASQAPNAERYFSVGTKDSQTGTTSTGFRGWGSASDER